jgi:hypothetical protein
VRSWIWSQSKKERKRKREKKEGREHVTINLTKEVKDLYTEIIKY